MKITNTIKLTSSLVALGLLAACGDSTTVNTEVGSFMKGQGAGVIYMTETHTGVTDENGAYQYEPGETISFYVGSTQLGATVPAGAELGPLDLTSGASIPVTGIEVKDFYQNFYEYGYGGCAPKQGTCKSNAETLARIELINILTILYSADSDKVSSNGVSISAQTHASLAGLNLDLSAHPEQLFGNSYYNTEFKYSLYDAYNAGGMDNARSIHYWKALDDYAALQGVTPEVYANTIHESDNDADGTIDTTYTSTFGANGLFSGYSGPEYSGAVQFNEYGDWLAHQDDHNDDGVIDSSGVQAYDIHGKILSFQSEYQGSASFGWTLTYDSQGNQLTNSVDNNGDGVLDDIYTNTYDAMNQLTSYTHDSGADGTIDYAATYSYDANGNRTEEAQDTDGDGNNDRIYYYQYNANDQQIYYASDDGADGSLNFIRTYTYDANGNQLERTDDTNGDGSPNRIYTYTYDANGNQLSNVYDSNGDGSPNSISTYTYDANGNRLTYDRDGDADGIIDRSDTYTYDANGNKLLETRDYDGDGSIDRTYAYAYNVNSSETYFARDNDGDGNLDYVRTSTYDANNNRTSRAYDEDGDGNIDREYSYTFDANGNQISSSYDSNGDGNPDRLEYNTYEVISFLGFYTWD